MTSHRRLPIAVVALIIVVLLSSCGPGGEDETATIPSTDGVTSTDENTAPISLDGTPIADVVGITTIVDNDCSVDADSYVDIDELGDSIDCALPAFPWPTDRTPNPARIIALLDQEGTYQGGFAYSVLSGTHTCIWEGYWLDATRTGDRTAADLSLNVLRSVLPYYGTVIPNYPAEVGAGSGREGYFLTLAQNAELGNVAYVQGDFDLNCPTLSPDLWAGS